MTPDYYISEHRPGWWAIIKNDGIEPARLFVGPSRNREYLVGLLERLTR